MQKDNVKAFKNELRNYNYYQSRVVSLGNSIEFCYDRLGGVRGVDPSKEPLHSAPNKEYEYQLREQIEVYAQKKALFEAKLKYIDEILGKMEMSLKQAVISVYAEGKQIRRVADIYYLSPMGLAKRMNKAIERALD